jgi:glycosyltransferase involved in cell wall biosynthesis
MVEVEMVPTISKTKLTFIVTSKPNQNFQRPLDGISKIIKSYPIDWEILVTQGFNPSQQRNEASANASGEYLVFFDNDSLPSEDYIFYFLDALRFDANCIAIGGISEVEHLQNIFQMSIKYVWASVFGIGFLRARYNSIGKVRYSSERELIMSNLIIKREAFLSVGGLNQSLFPNEENEFLNRLKEIGNICHHPLLIVKRPPRRNLREFIKQMISYGRGRANHFVIAKKKKDFIYFIPAFFCIYLFLLSFFYLYLQKLSMFLTLPLIAYFMLNLFSSLFNYLTIKNFGVAIRLPLLFFVCHISYGMGLIMGLFHKSNLNISNKNINLIKILDEIELKNRIQTNEKN